MGVFELLEIFRQSGVRFFVGLAVFSGEDDLAAGLIRLGHCEITPVVDFYRGTEVTLENVVLVGMSISVRGQCVHASSLRISGRRDVIKIDLLADRILRWRLESECAKRSTRSSSSSSLFVREPFSVVEGTCMNT